MMEARIELIRMYLMMMDAACQVVTVCGMRGGLNPDTCGLFTCLECCS